jgi:NADH-quinone oxidoreductase subunit A
VDDAWIRALVALPFGLVVFWSFLYPTAPLVLFALAAGFVGVSLAVSSKLGPNRPNPTKVAAYESGIIPEPETDVRRSRFAVKFYLVAMLFIIFDIETVFMLPWGAQFRQLSCTVPLVNEACPPGHITFFGLGEMLVFIGILLVGYVYVWKKGALQWD